MRCFRIFKVIVTPGHFESPHNNVFIQVGYTVSINLLSKSSPETENGSGDEDDRRIDKGRNYEKKNQGRTFKNEDRK